MIRMTFVHVHALYLSSTIDAENIYRQGPLAMWMSTPATMYVTCDTYLDLLQVVFYLYA